VTAQNGDEDVGSAPFAIACPACEKVGLIRAERVFRGASSYVAYYCGGCTYQWQTPHNGDRHNVAERPDHSRR
jgi:hypothetical protein